MNKFFYGIAFCAGLALVGAFVYVRSQNAEIETLQNANTILQANVKIALDAQKAGEEQINTLLQSFNELNSELVNWKQRYEKSAKETRRIQSRIRELETANADYQHLLSIPVPSGLWCEIFPESRRLDCQNRSQDNAVTGNIDAGKPNR